LDFVLVGQMSTLLSMVVRHLASVRNGILRYELGRSLGTSFEKGTGLAVEHVIGGLELLFILFVFCGLGASFLTNVVGIVYPAIRSIIAIETDGKDDDTEWLVYWVVYAGFASLEYFIDYVIFWIPFFYPLKIVFLVWCFSPEFKGANTIYVSLLPLIKSQSPDLPAPSHKSSRVGRKGE